MNSTISSRLTVGAALVVSLVSAAHADDVFNNFGPGNSFSINGRLVQGESVGTIANVDQADGFTVGSSSYIVTQVSLGIFVDQAPNVGTGPLAISLASDASGLPGAVLATFIVNVNTTGQQIVSGNFSGATTLTANTKYWMIADGRTTFDGAWDNNSIGDLGPTAGRSNLGPWMLNSNTDTRMAMEIQGRIVPVPEPAPFAAFGIGLLALVRRRRTA